MLRLTTPRFVREITYFEVWEHFKRFGDAKGPDSTTCRVFCPDDVAARLNERVKMRYLLEQFLVRGACAGGSGGEQRRCWTGDFSRTVAADRRALMEALLDDGWSLVQLNNCVAEREWLITTMTFHRERNEVS